MYPKTYTPKCLRPKKLKRQLEIMYAICKSEDMIETNMLDGPNPKLEAMLEVIGDTDQYILKFNPDGTSDFLYKWISDKWVLNNKF